MRPGTFLVLSLALAFDNVGTIWAHEVDIFRSWKLVGDPAAFHRIRTIHWRKGSPLRLTAVLWGRWQARLSEDPLGASSPYLAKILRTHRIRTLLINAYGFILLAWVIESL